VEILKSKHTTRELGKPKDWDDEINGKCDSLPIIDIQAEGCASVMVSLWKPSPKELEMLMSNGHIELWVYGDSHPVVAVSVNDVRE
jgi:hypothetical protein